MTVPGAPTPATPPSAEPPHRRRTTFIVNAVIVALLVGIGYAVWYFMYRERYHEGGCLNYAPARFLEIKPEFEAVDCSDPAAKSVILKVLDDPASGDEKRICQPLPGYIGSVSISKGNTHKILCLGGK